MDANVALTKIETPARLELSALPDYFSVRMRRRAQDRNAALNDACEHGFKTVFCALAAGLSAMLASVGSWQGSLVLWTFCSIGCVFITGVAAVNAWFCGERVKYLFGTRDETRYLPADCRTYAEQEARLLVAAETYNADVVKWRETLPLIEEHGDARHWAAAEKARSALEARREAAVNASARLWAIAASSEEPMPMRALSASPSPKALTAPSDWGPVETVSLDAKSGSGNT